ncbi:hypothetical protein Tco_0233003 [Tanacetum coccineum]
MLGKKPNKVYDPFLKARLGYQNSERLKKAIKAQPKMYNGDSLNSTKLKIDSPNSEETLENAEESQLKMKDKMIQRDYEKLNALNETFVPQTEYPIKQTYLSSASTSNVSSKSSEEMSDLPVKKMHNESKLLNLCSNEIKQEIKEEVKEIFDIFESMEEKVEKQSQKDKKIQNKIDRILETSLAREIRDCVMLSMEKQKNKLLIFEIEKISRDSKDIQATMEKRIKILENDFKRAEAQYIKLDIKMQHQKEKIACDVSWKSKMTKLIDENVLLKNQVESTVQERENIKLEYQQLFSIQ